MNTTSSIELEAKEIAKKLDLDDWVNTTAKREALITIKDLQFAFSFVNITGDEEQYIILHAKKFLLYNTSEPQGKKTSTDLIFMLPWAALTAQSRELVGAYLQHRIEEKHGYQLWLVQRRRPWYNPGNQSKLRKISATALASMTLKSRLKPTKKVVNFLDVRLFTSPMLNTGHNKRDNIRLYVNKKSNHPPRVIDNIPQSIDKRLSENLYGEESFKKKKKKKNLPGSPQQLRIYSSPYLFTSIANQTACSGRKTRKKKENNLV